MRVLVACEESLKQWRNNGGNNMLNIRIEDDKTLVEADGKQVDTILEAGFALYECISALRKCGKSDIFIEKMFAIALTHECEEGEYGD